MLISSVSRQSSNIAFGIAQKRNNPPANLSARQRDWENGYEAGRKETFEKVRNTGVRILNATLLAGALSLAGLAGYSIFNKPNSAKQGPSTPSVKSTENIDFAKAKASGRLTEPVFRVTDGNKLPKN